MQDTKVYEKVFRYFGILDTRVSKIFEYLDTLFRIYIFEKYLYLDTLLGFPIFVKYYTENLVCQYTSFDLQCIKVSFKYFNPLKSYSTFTTLIYPYLR